MPLTYGWDAAEANQGWTEENDLPHVSQAGWHDRSTALGKSGENCKLQFLMLTAFDK